jgi:hypothetical protein
VAGEHEAKAFTWDVGADQIDLDHWARTFVALEVQRKDERVGQVTRFGIWPVYAVLAVVAVVLATTGAPLGAVVMVGFAVAAGLGARLWNRGAADRLARRLHALPAASEPFTFRADASGTHSDSASGSEQLVWSRYRSVEVVADLVALRLDTDMVRLLPSAALVPPRTAPEAVEAIRAWIGPSEPS